MSAIASITLTDGNTTPVNRVFSPAKKDDSGVFHFENRATGIRIGFDQLTIFPRMGTKTTRATKLTLKLSTPIMEQTSPSTATGIQPIPTVAYTPLANIEFVLPDRSVLLDRKNLLAMIRDLLNESAITGMVENYDMPY